MTEYRIKFSLATKSAIGQGQDEELSSPLFYHSDDLGGVEDKIEDEYSPGGYIRSFYFGYHNNAAVVFEVAEWCGANGYSDSGRDEFIHPLMGKEVPAYIPTGIVDRVVEIDLNNRKYC